MVGRHYAMVSIGEGWDCSTPARSYSAGMGHILLGVCSFATLEEGVSI